MDLQSMIRSVPDFPVPGILFRDITTLLRDGQAYAALIDIMVKSLEGRRVDIVVGPEARGFVIGSALAYALKAGFVVARKPGKLPCKTNSVSYGLEYGTGSLEIHTDAIEPGQHVLVVDDLLATGGTALAAIHLIEKAGGIVECVRFVIELTELNGRAELEGYDVQSVMAY
ncbi:MAG: adenine phosphoribosyltransferase [Bacillota bacterium]